MARGTITPPELLERLQHYADTRVDAVLNTRDHTELALLEAPEYGSQVGARFSTPEVPNLDGKIVPITRYAHRQVAGRAQIPQKYYERMLQEAPELLMDNVHHWWQSEPESRLVRVIGNGDRRMRAWLSDRFRVIDNLDFLTTVFEAADDFGAQVHSAHVDDERLYVQMVTPLEREVTSGDPVRLGITVRNSEVGDGKVVVAPYVMRLVCTNGMVAPTQYRKMHLGGSYDEGVLSAETIAKENELIWSQVRDWVRFALDEENLDRIVGLLQRAQQVPVETTARVAVANVARRHNLSSGEGNRVLERFLIDAHQNGTTQFGLTQAVTRVAHDVDDYRRQVELEELGYGLVAEEADRFQALVKKPLSEDEVAETLNLN